MTDYCSKFRLHPELQSVPQLPSLLGVSLSIPQNTVLWRRALLKLRDGADPSLPTPSQQGRDTPPSQPFAKPPTFHLWVCGGLCSFLGCERAIAGTSSPPTSWQKPDTNSQRPQEKASDPGVMGWREGDALQDAAGNGQGDHSVDSGSHPGGGKRPLHSLLVTTSAYHTSLCLLITFAGLS